jgi:hypothetical protein
MSVDFFTDAEIGDFIEVGGIRYRLISKKITNGGSQMMRLMCSESGFVNAYCAGVVDGEAHWSIYAGSRCVGRFVVDEHGDIQELVQ